MEDDRTKEILKFIGSLSGWEVKFTKDTIQIGSNIRMYIEKFASDFDIKSFCKKIKISENDYQKFINGNWEYSLREISALESLWTEFEKSKVKVENIEIKK